VPATWISFFDLEGTDSGYEAGTGDGHSTQQISSSSGLDRLYRPPAQILALLLAWDPEPQGMFVFKTLLFLSKVHDSMRELLCSRDDKAL
jgi:hypothetical protein